MGDQPEHRIVVLGSGGVGKSALTLRLITKNFSPSYDPTIEDNYRTTVNIKGQLERLDILDTAGQEEYTTMRTQWMSDGEGFLLVYAIDMRSTFEELENFYLDICRAQDDDDVPIVICGNKCDLPDSERKVTAEEGRAMAEKWGCHFFETSAKEEINTREAFFQVVQAIKAKQGKNPQGDTRKKKRFCQIL